MGAQIGVQMGAQIGVRVGVQKGGPDWGVHVLYQPVKQFCLWEMFEFILIYKYVILSRETILHLEHPVCFTNTLKTLWDIETLPVRP